eukprot:2323171-Rhodomonas_salina.1
MSLAESARASGARPENANGAEDAEDLGVEADGDVDEGGVGDDAEQSDEVAHPVEAMPVRQRVEAKAAVGVDRPRRFEAEDEREEHV